MRKTVPNVFAIWTSLLLGGWAALLEYAALYAPGRLEAFVQANPESRTPFDIEGIPGLVRAAAVSGWIFVLVFLAGFAATFKLRPWALSLLRKCFLCAYLAFALYAALVWKVTAFVQHTGIPVDGQKHDVVTLFFWRWDLLWPAGALVLLTAYFHVLAWRRQTMRDFGMDGDPAPAVGDEILENLRTHGRDPQYRKSVLTSVAAHLFIIVLLPWLLGMVGCWDMYLIPKGGGDPIVQMVRIVKPEKKKKKKYVLSLDSAIIFRIPDLDESKVLEEVQEMSQATYVADANRVNKQFGQGKGKGPGWPEGSENAVFRFIRLEYSGVDWDDGIGTGGSHGRADMNFLDYFRKATGLKVASHPESKRIRELKNFKKGYAPPFVYMTGHGGINVSESERKILRDYLLDGGMLFADCGYRTWDRSFRGLMQSLFPDKPLLVIADDDPIFQFPFLFPHGAPPLWHHGGRRALGIKHKNRWIVFYHPGDVNDAWKTGHSGMDPQLADSAFQLGVNIVYYSFTNYLNETRKYRQ